MTASSATSAWRDAAATPSKALSAYKACARTGSSGRRGPDAARFATEASGAGTGTASTESRVRESAWEPARKKKLATMT